eukprot:TRINITY_DN533_c0_g1_i10.p1 TRINITY_DN533_c0_g1~~TRINITY_DN533_c0_g1_i10.p1  ORF type:complete len:279 (+),score=51.99 TRINITY_DN533_c0_g1_i10:156-992(+)
MSQVQLVEDGSKLLTATATVTRVPFQEKDALSQSKWCHLNFGEVLVVITTTGIVQVFDETVSRLLHTYRHPDAHVGLKGVSSDGDSRIFIGTSHGNVLVLTVTPDALVMTQTVCEQKTNISDVAANTQTVAVADMDGHIILLDPSNLQVTHIFPASIPDPCLTVSLVGQYLLAGYLSGKIRIFDISNPHLKVEIDAHSRPIYALHVHPHKPVFATGGEDTVVNVWSLPDADGKVALLYSSEVKDTLICGLQFAHNTENTVLCVAPYDFNHLIVIPFEN